MRPRKPLLSRILIIDADVSLARSLGDLLAIEGHDVERADRGAVGFSRVLGRRPDLVILDPALPDMNGLDLCRDLAGRAVAPILIVSASAQEGDKVRGLDLGADDYVTKPFLTGELLARIRVVLRRFPADRPANGTVRFADVVVDLDLAQVERGGVRVPFTQKEMDLLAFLLTHPNRVFTRDELLHVVWGFKEAPLTRTVDTHIARLRQKLEADPHDPRNIQTVHGTGYVFTL